LRKINYEAASLSKICLGVRDAIASKAEGFKGCISISNKKKLYEIHKIQSQKEKKN
jgi:hypothetical protein